MEDFAKALAKLMESQENSTQQMLELSVQSNELLTWMRRERERDRERAPVGEAQPREAHSTFKVPLPEFNGDGDVQAWVRRMESAAVVNNLSLENLARAASLTSLKGGALSLIESTARATTDWDLLKTTLIEQYKDPNREMAIRGQLRQLQLKGTDIEAYWRKFSELCSQIEPPLSPVEKFERFFFGLDANSRSRVLQAKVATAEEALNVVRVLFNECLTTGVSYNGVAPMDLNRMEKTKRKEANSIKAFAPKRKETRECYFCGKTGHLAAACFAKMKAQQGLVPNQQREQQQQQQQRGQQQQQRGQQQQQQQQQQGKGRGRGKWPLPRAQQE
jgi:hypothetical protein